MGSGKTTFCKHVIDSIRASTKGNWSIKGILSPGTFDGDKKIGIETLDLATGERRRFAQRRTDSSSGILTKQWSLERSTIDWCNQVLQASVPCDLLVADELGPLEFERDEGFYEAMIALDSGQYQAALVVVRTEFLHFAVRRWPDAIIHTVRVREQAITSAETLLKNIGV